MANLGCRPPKGEASYKAKGAVDRSKKKYFALCIKFKMHNTVIWLIQANYVAGTVNPPEKKRFNVGIEHLLLSHV